MDNSDMSEEEIISRDRQANPGCHYSSSSSHVCSSQNGSFVCEVLKQIQRNCPGKRPESIFYSKTVDDGAKGIPDMPNITADIEKHFGGLQGGMNPFGMFGDLLGRLPDMFPGFSAELPHGDEVPHSSRDFPVIPPHKMDKYKNKAENPSFNIRVGPIEKI
jgi:hypothetical protein